MKKTFGTLLAVAFASACGQSGEPVSDAGSDAPPAESEAAAPDESGTSAGTAAFEAADYGDMANWLCHPDKAEDACSVDLSYTVVEADGTTRVEAFEAADNPPIDCFYLYPTISSDPGANSDLEPGPEEKRVTASQFARFAEVCRPFAPVYRQITLTQLMSAMAGGEFRGNLEMRYADVKGAWETYLDTRNNGRGVVLIGHSQGADMIQTLLETDIIGTPAEDLIVSVMPIGFSTYVDAETGAIGPFGPCITQGQTGCLVSYVSFRETIPPPESSLFGQTAPDGVRALCVNPAELSGDEGMLDARLSTDGFFGIETASFVNGEGVDTPYAAVPGLLSAECVEGEGHTYLEVTVHGDPADPRTDDISGDVIVEGEVSADWGLHLVDMNLAMGNLLKIVRAQGESRVAAQAAGEE